MPEHLATRTSTLSVGAVRGRWCRCWLLTLLAATPGALAQAPAPAATGDSARTEALRLADAWLESVQAYDRLPALSVAVVQGEELVLARGYGAIDAQCRRSRGSAGSWSVDRSTAGRSPRSTPAVETYFFDLDFLDSSAARRR
jgi:hypothetical protein